MRDISGGGDSGAPLPGVELGRDPRPQLLHPDPDGSPRPGLRSAAGRGKAGHTWSIFTAVVLASVGRLDRSR